jgi:hypothetical protein
LLRHRTAGAARGLWSNSHWFGAGVKVGGMNLPPDSPRERRAVPRHIRDGEHEMWQDGVDAAPGAGPGRRWRVLVYVAVAAALVLGLWLYNGVR